MRWLIPCLLLCLANSALAKPARPKLPQSTSKLPDLWVATPAGWTDLVVDSIRYSDDLRMPAQLQVSGRTSTKNTAKHWIGQSITVAARIGKDFRYWNGIVDEVTISQEQVDAAVILEIRTWPFLLRRAANVRPFENKSIPELIETVLKPYDFASYEFRLTEKYPKRPLLFQYRETDLNLLTRSLEDAGIFMVTEFGKTGHKVIFTDAQPQKASITLNANQREGDGSAYEWRRTEQVVARSYALRSSFGWDSPTGEARGDGPLDVAMYDFEQSDGTKEGLDRQSKVRFQESQAQAVQLTANTGDGRLAAGTVIELKGHATDDGLYLVTMTSQAFSSEPGQPMQMHVMFQAIPNAVHYRPQRMTAEPMIGGPQLAEVRELDAKKPERVRVWFRWDRDKDAKQKGSAWVPVSPKLAGKAFAVGDWVMVGFSEGDPDLPMVISAVQPPTR